jgi:hypothetical protein
MEMHGKLPHTQNIVYLYMYLYRGGHDISRHTQHIKQTKLFFAILVSRVSKYVELYADFNIIHDLCNKCRFTLENGLSIFILLQDLVLRIFTTFRSSYLFPM